MAGANLNQAAEGADPISAAPTIGPPISLLYNPDRLEEVQGVGRVGEAGDRNGRRGTHLSL